MADIIFTDGTPNTWRLMEDGTKRGLGWPVEYNLRNSDVIRVTITPAQAQQIADWVAPVTVIPPVTIPPVVLPALPPLVLPALKLVGSLGAAGVIVGSVTAV